MHRKFNKPHELTLFGFLMISISMVVSIYAYPTFATAGLPLVFFLVFAGLCWFIPVCLSAAEMGTGGKGWSNAGVYSWGAAALGKRWGFKMIYLQFMQISIGFVPMLYFITGALSYLFDAPALSQPGWPQFLTIFGIFWGISFANYGGTKITKYIAIAGFVLGVVVPAVILIGLGWNFVLEGNKLQFALTFKDFFPDFHKASTLVVIASFILSFMGAEASAIHVSHLKNPGRNYPLSIFILALITITVGSLSSLTIAITVPEAQISLDAGILEAFQFLFDHYGIGILRYPIAALVAISTVAEISSWVNGPVRGMLFAAQEGLLPPKCAHMNKHHMPIILMWIQGALVTTWMAVLTFGSTGGSNMAFFTAIALTVIAYLTMYVLLFISYLILKTKVPDSKNPRRFSLPPLAGRLVACLGLFSTLFALVIAFARPEQIPFNKYSNYLMILISCYIMIVILPHIMYAWASRRETAWKKQLAQMHKKGDTHQHKA